MGFLNSDAHASNPAIGKIAVTAVIVVLGLGGGLYWYVNRAPAERLEVAMEKPSAPAPKEEPAPAAPRRSAPDVPSTGSLLVTANVDGAVVYLDGDSVGAAPYEDTGIHIGRYEIRVSKGGYEDFVEEVRVRPGKSVRLRASLDRLPPSLRIVSDVAGATVFLDRNYMGTTPVDIKDVAPGEHQLTVSAEGFEMHVEKITVTQGHRDVAITFERAPTNFSQAVAVIHKHGFGNCSGTLVADMTGIRYETQHKDAFSAGHPFVERFELDYVKKNMNVKVVEGRNYNFTAQSGNADDLFVFHREVQAFRQTF